MRSTKIFIIIIDVRRLMSTRTEKNNFCAKLLLNFIASGLWMGVAENTISGTSCIIHSHSTRRPRRRAPLHKFLRHERRARRGKLIV
jgi:hypothetical protein